MSEQGVLPSVTEAPTDNDRLWAALAYVLCPLIPILIVLMEENKKRAFQRYHAIQSIALGVVVGVLFIVVAVILTITIVGALCLTVLWVVPVAIMFYYAYLAYQGQYAEVPYLTKFLRDQKWI